MTLTEAPSAEPGFTPLAFLATAIGADSIDRARSRLRLKAVVIVFAQIGSYGVVMLGHASPVLVGLGIIGLLLSTYGSVAAVMHDANHDATFKSDKLNRLLGNWIEFQGGSAHWWRHKHNATHHVHANVDQLDPDIHQAPFLRLNPHQNYRRWYRFQHLYAPVLYGFMMLHVFGSDALALWKLHRSEPMSGAAIAGAVLGKVCFVTAAAIVPFLVFGWWGLVGSFALFWTVGLALSLTVQIAHAVDIVEHFDNEAPRDVVVHQASVTADVHSGASVGAWLFRFLCGGLDRQLAHHLVPSFPHTAYAQLQQPIEALLASHGQRYRFHRSVPAAVASHFRWLKAMGRPV